ncbi:MAG: CYTH domain-containing protein [Microcoleaceae cyanobacterium]
MATEIERKFLVIGDEWKSLGSGTLYRQGYIPTTENCSVRVRAVGEIAYLTLKGPTIGNSRAEFEYDIPLKDAEEILGTLCSQPLIEKYRYRIPWGNLVWEVDEFLGDNQGLIVAEIELQTTDQSFELPTWIGEEVSDDPKYFNASLVKFPYCQWSSEEAEKSTNPKPLNMKSETMKGKGKGENLKFENKVQQECYEKVTKWMDKLFGDYPWEALDGPGFGLFMGSAWVEVQVYPWGKKEAVINARSKVVSGAEITPELMMFLLQENAGLLFGAFSIDQNGDILFEHTIVGSTCDREELDASVKAVLSTADEYDDRIIEKWGGKRALDVAP